MNKKRIVFQGVATALITPFIDGQIDLPAFRKILRKQICGKVNGLVLCGTTGESPTLTDDERARLLHAAQEEVEGRLPLVMGTGGNDTASALTKSRYAASHGADALLVVTPYYNKGTKEGILRHYLTIADAVDIPVILYNVPSRTGVDLSPDMLEKLAEHPNIVALKEANGNIDRIADTACRLANDLTLYSGNDSQILPVLSLGGNGVISVVSNILPCQTSALCQAFFSGDVQEARRIQLNLLPFIQLLFNETNPAPIKAAMSIGGFCKNELRLPLAPISKELFAKIEQELAHLMVNEKEQN